MALLDHSKWRFWAPKPVSSKGTAKAFAAGDAMFQRKGINPTLKAAMKKAILAERKRAE